MNAHEQLGGDGGMKRSRLKSKPRRPKPGDDPAYLRWIREQPCAIKDCVEWFGLGVEAAHFGRRSIALKPPDSQALPLCPWHHRLGPWAHHHFGSDVLFEQAHGINIDELIAEHRARYEAEREQ